VLLKANPAIVQLYHTENNVFFKGMMIGKINFFKEMMMMMMSALY
jgi:hypothetical protein